MTTSSDGAVPGRRVMIARHTSGDPTVHLLPLPLSEHRDGASAVAYCGARIPAEYLEAVEPERSAGQDWCVLCFTAYTTGAPPAALPGANPRRTPTAAGRAAAAQTYVSYGWPVVVTGQDICLDLSRGGLAVAIPMILAADITDVLVARRCAPAVLAHPAMPSHRVILAGERYGVPLGWPRNIHRITTTVPLPPTVTRYGPLLWTRLPEPRSLALCREIDILAALRTVLTSHPESKART